MTDDSVPLPPPTGPAQTHDEISAEIADHLAAAESDLSKRGVVAAEAREAARRKFGDVEKIQKTCYWIQNGETIMLRWTLIALASALCLLLGLSVFGNWRSQTQLAEEMGKLSAELKAIALTKQAPAPIPQPPEITGVIYARSKDTPVANANVTILRTDGTVIRQTRCDEKGVYRSGPLEPGDFCITSPIQQAPEQGLQWVAQSQPVILHSASGETLLDMDAAYAAGGIKVSINGDLPKAFKSGNYRIEPRIHIFVEGSRQRDYLWTAREDFPHRWPVYGNSHVSMQANRKAGISSLSQTFDFYERGQEHEFSANSQTAAILPPEEIGVEAALWVEAHSVDGAITHFSFMSNRLPQKTSLPKVTVKDGQFIKIHVEIPPGIDQEIHKALDPMLDSASLEGFICGGRLCRPLAFKVSGYEPMKDSP